MTAKQPAIFFDRDGVLCQAVVRDGHPCPPMGLADLQLMPGARLSCDALRAAGYQLVMVTNQPDIATGQQSSLTVGMMNLWLQTELALDLVQVCPHQESDGCTCRTPAPGMLTEAATQLNLDLARSFMVGDRAGDIEAGTRAGCHTVFIDHHYKEERPENAGHTAGTLLEAAQHILQAEPRTEPNSAGDFLMGLVERGHSVSEFRKTRAPQAPVEQAAAAGKEASELAVKSPR